MSSSNPLTELRERLWNYFIPVNGEQMIGRSVFENIYECVLAEHPDLGTTCGECEYLVYSPDEREQCGNIESPCFCHEVPDDFSCSLARRKEP